MSELTEKELRKLRQRRFRETRTLIAVRKVLIDGLRQAAFMEGRSMANLVNYLIWRHLEANGLTVTQGITDWSWRQRPDASIKDEIDKQLGDTNVS
jgi:hypothetical protein